MTDIRDTNHLLLSVWLLGAIYGLKQGEKSKAVLDKATAIKDTDIHKDVKGLWQGTVNGNSREAVAWLENHGVKNIGNKIDTVDAVMAFMRQVALDKRAAELVEKMRYSRGAAATLEAARQIIAELT